VSNREPSTDQPNPAAEALARELYWAGPLLHGDLGGAGASLDAGLPQRWYALEETLLWEYTQRYPEGEEVLLVGGRFKRAIKRMLFRVVRPLTRRYDRVGADIARLGRETADVGIEVARSLEVLRHDVATLRERIDVLTDEVRKVETLSRQRDARIGSMDSEVALLTERFAATPLAPAAGPVTDRSASDLPTLAPVTPDPFYWRFETEMRGSHESLERKLRQYEDLALEIRAGSDSDPLWIDLGCGEGDFALLVRSWGFRVFGVDISPQAVAACAERGIDAVVGALPDYLADYTGEPPAALSAIQVIEHLPPATWLPTLRYAQRRLAPGGACIVETINPLNVTALSTYFFGDITHTWPANPRTLTIMAEFAGFDAAEVRLLNPDERGDAQDFALIARNAR
jgi:hypothetical protein